MTYEDKRGRLEVIPLREYTVHCFACGRAHLVSAVSMKVAEGRLKKEDGWEKRSRRWFCSDRTRAKIVKGRGVV